MSARALGSAALHFRLSSGSGLLRRDPSVHVVLLVLCARLCEGQLRAQATMEVGREAVGPMFWKSPPLRIPSPTVNDDAREATSLISSSPGYALPPFMRLSRYADASYNYASQQREKGSYAEAYERLATMFNLIPRDRFACPSNPRVWWTCLTNHFDDVDGLIEVLLTASSGGVVQHTYSGDYRSHCTSKQPWAQWMMFS
ncbi:hypothetical protein NMY22_g3538 [Coprinellus aureogranulatus]|nr:hypothetical protein NMY22_g3538 [Coprinellus aureogranulatus]